MNVSKSTQIKSVQLLLVFLSIISTLSFGLADAHYTAASWFTFLMRKKKPQALPSPQANGSEDFIWSGQRRFPARVKV